MSKILSINDFSVSVGSKKVVKNLNLSIDRGQVHAIMGPNGSGKSSLAYGIVGHPRYIIVSGNVIFCGKNLNKLSTDKRSKLGLFLAFQYPQEIPGATVFAILKELYREKLGKLVSVAKFSEILFSNMDLLKIDRKFAYRSLNESFSGGEKKKFEILQMLILCPKFVILDEIDSGLDIDSLRVVSSGILHAKSENPDMSILIITHYQRILEYINPDFVHIMHNGEIKKSGDFILARNLEAHGYKEFING